LIKISVRFLGPLKTALNRDIIQLTFQKDITLGSVIEELKNIQGFTETVLEPNSNNIRPEIIILLNDREVFEKDLNNVALKDGDTITMIPMVHGGSSSFRNVFPADNFASKI